MQTIEQPLRELNGKLQQLLKKYAALQKENQKLSGELEEWDKKEKALTGKVGLLQMENSILKASAGKMEEKERTGFEKQINQYIKDIEKCMTMLNK